MRHVNSDGGAYGLGRRKTSQARVNVWRNEEGKGKMTVNGQGAGKYFLAIKELGDVFEIFGSIGGAFIVFFLPAQFIRREGGGRGRMGSEIMLNGCGLLLLVAICVAGLHKA